VSQVQNSVFPIIVYRSLSLIDAKNMPKFDLFKHYSSLCLIAKNQRINRILSFRWIFNSIWS